MAVIFNGKLVQLENVQFATDNRAFAYGDGLFETMIVRRGTCALLDYHYQRLLQGIKLLGMEVPFSQKKLEGYLWELATKYGETPILRMRLQLWRKPGGLYTPQSQGTEYLITATSFKKPVWHKEKVSFSTTVQLSPSSFSHLKTMSALPYVLAGLEMKNRLLDDIILTDTKGNIAEASAANLFWLLEGTWFTPDLKSGCIAGVMRAYLLDKLRQQNVPVKEVLLPKEKLKEADVLIACNATGLYTIKSLDYHVFDSGREKLAQFIQLPGL